MHSRPLVQTLIIQILLVLCASQVWAGCLHPPVSDQSISQFRSNPKGLVAPDADTQTIESLVRDLAGTDATLAADLVHVAEGTQPRFQTAIAAGLAQAAVACANLDQQAAFIQQAVASFEDGQFQAAFAAVAGDLSTAATDAATSSAAGSAGSVTVTDPNPSTGSKTTPGGGGNIPLVLFEVAGVTISSDNSVKSSSPAPGSVATTAANPVSSTR